MNYFLVVFSIIGFIGICSGGDWGYKNDAYGPDNWKKDYPICLYTATNAQSPIDIPRDSAAKYEPFTAFTLHHFNDQTKYNLLLKNNGHTAQVDIALTSAKAIYVTGGGLQGQKYIPAQFHFHWGSNDMKGSEHTVNTQKFPLELHLVTYNDKYSTIGDAVSETDGLAVLGFLFEIGDQENTNLKTVVDSLLNVVTSQSNKSLTGVNIEPIVPVSKNFYRYKGSLTTPPCYESVTWTVFKETIKITAAQMAEFRKLKDYKAELMVDNFRPTGLLTGRTVSRSYKTADDDFSAASQIFIPTSIIILSVISSLLI